MLTAEQKRAIEIQAAQVIRRSWGGLNGARVRGVIDDIRAKVIEEGWFGKPTTEHLNEIRYLANEPDKADLGRLYEKGTATLQEVREAVFGKDIRESETRQASLHGRDRDRNEPDLER